MFLAEETTDYLFMFCVSQRQKTPLLLLLPFGVSIVSESQSPTHCDPMDYTVHGILQARILEWVAIPFSRRSSQPRDGTQVSHITGRFFTS